MRRLEGMTMARGVGYLVGALWLVAAGAFVVEPASSTLENTRVVLGSLPIMILACAIGAIAAVEMYLAALFFGAGRRDLAFRASIVLVTVLSAYLVIKGVRTGWGTPCGCLAGVLGESVGAGLFRNVLLVVLLSLGMRAERRVSRERIER